MSRIDAIGGKRAVVALLGGLVVLSAALVGWVVFVDAGQAATSNYHVREVSAERGLTYTYEGHQVVNGNAGVYVADYDNDGWQDLLLIGNESRGPVLFHNTGGAFEASGVLPASVTERRIHSALFFDYDNDGWSDLLLLPDPGKPSGGYTATTDPSFSTKTTHPIILHNEGGTFAAPVTLDNVTLQQYPIGATTADYDGDGCLDVFVYQNGDWSDRTPVGYRNPSTVGNITTDNGEPNLLLDGDCTARFTDVSDEAGITGERWSLAASFVDVTGDGLPDVHVANDFNEDVLYVNQGNGTFAVRRLGDTTDRNGMSSEVGDVNGDHRPDIYVTNIGMASRQDPDLSKDTGAAFHRQAAARSPRYTKGNQLLVNQPGPRFVDKAPAYGVKDAPYVWGWAAVMADLDNDADLDVVHANNEKSSVTNTGSGVMLRWTNTPPGLWENTGTYSRPAFESVPAISRGFVKMNARGMARLDYDRDGDLDIVAADEGNSVKLFENQVTSGHWLQIAVGRARSAGTVGAQVTVTTGNRTQFRVANARVDFLSQETRILHVGLGDRETVDRLRVVWPDGTTRTFTDVRADRRIRVFRNGTLRTVPGGTGGVVSW